MKSDAGHAVPLSDDAIRILESLPRFTKGDHLFSSSYAAAHRMASSTETARCLSAMPIVSSVLEMMPVGWCS